MLSFLHSPTLASIYDHWKNHSLYYILNCESVEITRGWVQREEKRGLRSEPQARDMRWSWMQEKEESQGRVVCWKPRANTCQGRDCDRLWKNAADSCVKMRTRNWPQDSFIQQQSMYNFRKEDLFWWSREAESLEEAQGHSPWGYKELDTTAVI